MTRSIKVLKNTAVDLLARLALRRVDSKAG